MHLLCFQELLRAGADIRGPGPEDLFGVENSPLDTLVLYAAKYPQDFMPCLKVRGCE